MIGENCRVGESEGDIALIGHGTNLKPFTIVKAGQQVNEETLGGGETV